MGLRIARAATVATALCVLGAGRAQARPAEWADPEDPPGESAEPAATAGADAGGHVRAAPKPAEEVSFGAALRARYVSVPGWMLGLFTSRNVPLSTFGHFGIEFFRRRGKTDLVGALSYQNMSPPDGNWLAIDHQAAADTNFVQSRGLAIYNIDVAFVSRETFTDWVGMHYGAGLGIGIVAGDVLRTVYGCNQSDFSRCRPPITIPPRKVSLPPVIPIVNVVVGFDFRVPSIEGWEAKIEAGFYDALFLGLGLGYRF